jgi:uncharacterized protein YhaN
MKVQWLKLTLRGFGRFQETVTVEFVPGVNVFLAANEQGKSTLAAGLAAVIYGLPAAADPRSFSQERFRNWHGPAQFSGELEFAAGGDYFRLQRNFDNHRVSLQRLVSGSWLEEIGGEHNPRAQKRNVSYEEAILRLLGVGSRELFTATFQVTQPLPEGEKIIPGIQQLLSGAGAHYKTALDSLRDDLKKLTRLTGRRGITQRDMNQDRTLELLESEILKVEHELASATQLLIDVQETATYLDGLQARSKEQGGELAEKERLISAWQEWRILRDRYQQAASTQASLTASVEKAALLERSVQETVRTLDTEYGEFEGSPSDTGEALTVFSALDEEMHMMAAALQETAGQISGEEQAAENLERLLQGELAAVRGRPGLPHICRELRNKEQELQDLQNRTLLAATRLADLEGQLLLMPPLQRLGKSPVQTIQALREQSQVILAQWRQFAAELEVMARLEVQIRDEYALFRRSGDEELAALAAYETRSMRLERELERLNAARSEALRKVEEAQLAHKTMIREFSEMERLGDDAESMVARKLDLLAAKREQEESLRHLSVRITPQEWRRRAGSVAAAMFCGAAAFLAGAGSLLAVLAGLATGLASVLLTGFLTRRKERSGPQARLGEINVGLRQVDTLLGPFSTRNEAQLGELRQKLRERQERRRQLAAMQAALPGEDELRPLKAELDAAKEEWRKFKELVSGAEKMYSDVPAAFNRWRELEREAADLQRRTDEFASRQSPGTPADRLLDSPPSVLRAPWPELIILGELLGAATGTVRSVLSWVETLDSIWWEQTEASARSFESLLEEVDIAKLEMAALTGPDAEGTRRGDLLRQEIAALREQLLPFDSLADPLWLESQQTIAREAEEGLLRHGSTLEALRKQHRELAEKLRRTEIKFRPLQERLSALLPGGTPDVVLQRWQEYSRLSRRKSAEEMELAGLLAAHQVSSPGDLRRKAADSANQAVGILRQWEELLASYPALPARDNDNPQVLDNLYRELERRIDRLREEDVSLHNGIRDAELRLARLQGQAPLNIAGGELRLQELREEVRQLRTEADALELAHKELSAAIRLFSETYRQGLAGSATGYFSFFTGNCCREVLLDEQFNVQLREDGKLLSVSYLSQGARDQLYLALRLAVADLLSDDIQLPFVFDDPFLNWDEVRMAKMQQTLLALPSGRQVLLFSHRQEFASWGNSVRPES